MTWVKYQLVFRLLSPLHVGAGRVGNLQRTRGYVHGKSLWAALTARLARDGNTRPDGPAYEQMGREVSNAFRFGYLYPALAENGPPCYPWEPDFAYFVLGSYASTALTDDNAGAEDGTLHETEFISPQARAVRQATRPQPVFLVGDLWVLGDGVVDWQAAFKMLQLGGEKGYGWGHVKLLSDFLTGVKDEPIVRKRAGEPTLAHVDVATAQTVLRGPIEPLLGWERNNQGGPPWRLSPPSFCFAPGARVLGDAAFRVREFGIWEYVGKAG